MKEDTYYMVYADNGGLFCKFRTNEDGDITMYGPKGTILKEMNLMKQLRNPINDRKHRNKKR